MNLFDLSAQVGYKVDFCQSVRLIGARSTVNTALRHAEMNTDNTAAAKNFIDDLDDLSEDTRLNKLLKTVVKEVKDYAEYQIDHIKKRAEIAMALSMESDIDKLLEMIVDEARSISNADGGTLYTVDEERTCLRFKILQNETMNTRMGGAGGSDIDLPDVPLFIDGKPNYSNVSSYVALTGETENFPDVYEAEGFDFTGPRKYDAATGYRSKSMLVIPLRNHEDEIIGVLQLLNAKDLETGQVVPFAPQYADLVASMASQAAVVLTTTQLLKTLKNLFYAFIKTIATAIDRKSPYTGGHINRVVDIAMMIADKINETGVGPFKTVAFSEDELEELRIAAWMHDVGKIATPEIVVDKRTRLEAPMDRIALVETRFRLIISLLENAHLKKKIRMLREGTASDRRMAEEEAALRHMIDAVEDDLEFIKTCNDPKLYGEKFDAEFIGDRHVERIREIAAKTYRLDGKDRPFLEKDEVKHLMVRKGTLTEEERLIIEKHATMTLEMLKQLPFPRKLARVPKYAAAHHEKLDGSGYPLGLKAEDLPLQARILVIADIFEALTARDRPYKGPMTLSQAVGILGAMKEDNHIDPDLYDLFINSGLYYQYARKSLNPEQVDITENGLCS